MNFLPPPFPSPLKAPHSSPSTPRCSQSQTPPDPTDPTPANLSSLRLQLTSAITSQNFSLAASLRDEIRALETNPSDTVTLTLANDSFYHALSARSLSKMSQVWLSSDSVSCAHPLRGIVIGYDDVLDTWKDTFRRGGGGQTKAEIQRIELRRNIAWVIVLETNESLRANKVPSTKMSTNIFQKRRGGWLMVHHHASPIVS